MKVYKDTDGSLCIMCEDVDGNAYIMNENGYFQIEDPELHWLNKFSPAGEIMGFLDPVTKDFIQATDPKEIARWNKWFEEWKKRNKNIIKSYKF